LVRFSKVRLRKNYFGAIGKVQLLLLNHITMRPWDQPQDPDGTFQCRFEIPSGTLIHLSRMMTHLASPVGVITSQGTDIQPEIQLRTETGIKVERAKCMVPTLSFNLKSMIFPHVFNIFPYICREHK